MRRRELMRSRRELMDSLNHSREMLAEINANLEPLFKSLAARDAKIAQLKAYVLHLSALVQARAGA